MLPPSCRTIFFDAAGTLIHLSRRVGEHYRQVAVQFGVAPDAAELERAFRGAWKAAPARALLDGPRPDDDKGWWRALVRVVFDEVLSPAESTRFDFDSYFEAVYAHFAQPGVWELFSDVRPALQQLQARGYRLGVISNFDGRLRPILTDLGILPAFDPVVISSEVGAEKPEPRIFRRALELAGVDAANALHVGDDPHADWGAEAVGLHVFRLERPRHTFADLLATLGT